MQHDRARIQLGRISAFGLLELSRQRLHPSLVETNFEVCKHCTGSGLVRTVETTAVLILRALEEEGLKGRAAEVKVSLPTEIALYIFNSKREMLSAIEKRYNIKVFLNADDTLLKPAYTIEVVKTSGVQRDLRPARPAPVQTVDMSDLPELTGDDISDDRTVSEDDNEDDSRGVRQHGDDDGEGRGDRGGRHNGGRDRNDRNRGRDRGGRDRNDRNRGGDRNHHRNDRPQHQHVQQLAEGGEAPAFAEGGELPAAPGMGDDDNRGGRRRGRRGGRRRGRNRGDRPQGDRAPGEQGQGGEFVDLAGSPQPDITGGEFVAEGVTEGGEPRPQHQGNRDHRGGRDRHRGGRHRGGRDRNDRHQRQQGDNAPAGEGQQSFNTDQPVREEAPRHDHNHDHAGHDHSHAHDNQPQNDAATGTDDGKARKGWWKRLTE
jgi:ribonuclease E